MCHEQWALTVIKRLRFFCINFVTHIGVFQVRRLAFGFSSAPSAFQQIVRKMIEGIPGCVNILDDILVSGRNTEEHDE